MRSLHRHPFPLRPLARPAAILLTAGVGLFALAPRAGAADDKAPSKKPAAAKEADADAKPDEKAGDDAAGDKITYAKIQPILKESCVQCHRAPGAGGPGGPGGGPGGPPGQRRGPGGGPGGG